MIPPHSRLQTIRMNRAMRAAERLLPDDVNSLFSEIRDEDRDRIICDFIAGMTDRYAIEFYGRLKSERPETIFKPH